MGIEALTRIDTVEGFEVFSTGDGSKWIRDIQLAENAGLAEPRKIRRVIAKAIEDRGILPRNNGGLTAPVVPGPYFRTSVELLEGGNGTHTETTVYYLNYDAALVVIQRMRTAKAVQLQKAMARVFVAVATGEAPVGNYDRFVDRITIAIESLSGTCTGLRSDFEKHREEFKSFQGEVRDSFNQIVKRRPCSESTLREHTEACLAYYGGRCIACRDTLIVNADGSRTADFTIEHFIRRDHSGAHETAPVCRDCNCNRIERDRASYSSTWAEYQRVRSQHNGPLFGGQRGKA